MGSISSASSGSPGPLLKSPKKHRRKEKKCIEKDNNETAAPSTVQNADTAPNEEPPREQKPTTHRRRRGWSDWRMSRRGQSHALKGMREWTWEAATARAPGECTPDVGPKNEPLSDDDRATTGYQGMPREHCQLLYGMDGRDASNLETFYRQLKEAELAGSASGSMSIEQKFEDAVIKYKAGVLVVIEEQRLEAERSLAEKERKFQQGNWPKTDRDSEEGSKWPKWGEEQPDDVLEGAPPGPIPNKLVERLGLPDRSPTPEPEGK